MVEMNEDGFIIGGKCDNIHIARALREKGAKMYFDRLVNEGSINFGNEHQKLDILPEISEEEIYKIGFKFGSDVEIGYRRFKSDVVGTLFIKKKLFKISQLEKWMEDISSFEFGISMENPLSFLEGTANFGYVPPHQDHLYEKRKERGDFDEI